MLEQILQAKLVHMNETPCVVRGRDGKRTKFKDNSYFWPILADAMVVFYYTGSRLDSNVEEIIGQDLK